MGEYRPLKVRDNSLALYAVIFSFFSLVFYIIAKFFVGKIFAMFIAFLGSTTLVFATIILLKLLLRKGRNDTADRQVRFPVSMSMVYGSSSQLAENENLAAAMDFVSRATAATLMKGFMKKVK